MSLMVTGIRLPFDLPEQAAIAEARRLTGLTANDIQAAVCRVSIDARRGQISRVYSVRLDAPFDEKAFAEKLQMPFVRYKPNTKIVIPHGEKRLEHRSVARRRSGRARQGCGCVLEGRCARYRLQYPVW